MIAPSDVKQITMSLLEDKAFLTALAHNNTFASALSQNDEFVNSVLKNPKFTKGINCLAKEEITVSYGSPEFVQALEYGVLNTDIFCEVPTRLRNVEYETGLVFHDEDDEYEPTIHERIQDIESKITNYEPGLAVSPQIEIKQKTKTGKRAMHLIKTLMASGKGHLTHAQIKTALSDETLEDCRITPDCSNPRRIIIDALNEAERICSSVLPDKKGYGRHEWRLLLKS